MLDRAEYEKFRVSPDDPATLRCDEVEAKLRQLAESSGGRLKVEKFAESVEGRPIYLATIGSGPKRILMWTQMHGDEPTHTGVVLDLMSYILRVPDVPLAADILRNSTLMIIPMLNPDGAEKVIRFNAQGIDVNRDWRRLATPEGRALKRAAETLSPEFAFNLHNQNARTSVGRAARPAAVSVLAPAPDATRSESPSMRIGKQMCTCFVEAVRPFAQGMISRYDDAYEPRAFGDGIQSLGVATMLVEAGGWPDSDPEPMTRLHFHGMLSTLHAIATDKHRSADPQVYEALPESNSTRLVDCTIARAGVLDAMVDEAFTADLVIEQTHSVRLAATQTRDGRIVEIGDLPPAAAKLAIDASDLLLLPGQVMFLPKWAPSDKLDRRQLEELISHGTTIVLGAVDLADRDSVESLATLQSLPINWGFVAMVNAASKLPVAALVERTALAAAAGVLAVVTESADESLWRTVHQFGLPLLKPEQLPSAPATSYREAAKRAWNVANGLALQSRRGRINRNYFADLLFFDTDAKATQPVDWQRLDRVMVAGEIVWRDGKFVDSSPGVMVRRA